MFDSFRSQIVSEYIRKQDLISQLENMLKKLNLVPNTMTIGQDIEGHYVSFYVDEKYMFMYLDGYINISKGSQELFSGEFPRDIETVEKILRV